MNLKRGTVHTHTHIDARVFKTCSRGAPVDIDMSEPPQQAFLPRPFGCCGTVSEGGATMEKPRNLLSSLLLFAFPLPRNMAQNKAEQLEKASAPKFPTTRRATSYNNETPSRPHYLPRCPDDTRYSGYFGQNTGGISRTLRLIFLAFAPPPVLSLVALA